MDKPRSSGRGCPSCAAVVAARCIDRAKAWWTEGRPRPDSRRQWRATESIVARMRSTRTSKVDHPSSIPSLLPVRHRTARRSSSRHERRVLRRSSEPRVSSRTCWSRWGNGRTKHSMVDGRSSKLR